MARRAALTRYSSECLEGGVLGTSGVEFLEVRLLWPFLGNPRKFARGKLEGRPRPTPAAG
jgi:hypothetical protein